MEAAYKDASTDIENLSLQLCGVRFVRVSFSEVLNAHSSKSSHPNKQRGAECVLGPNSSSATNSSTNKVPFLTVPASSPMETYDNSWTCSGKNHKEMVSWGTRSFL